MLYNSMIFVVAFSNLDLYGASNKAHNMGERSKEYFPEISQVEQQIKIPQYFSWKVNEFSEF